MVAVTVVCSVVSTLAAVAMAIATYINLWPRHAARTAWRMQRHLYLRAQAREKPRV